LRQQEQSSSQNTTKAVIYTDNNYNSVAL